MSEEGAADPIAKPRRKKARASSKTIEPAERPVADETDDRVRAADARAMLQRLAGKPAADVLSRISNGDPLRLYPLCARHIRERCFVLDPDRVFERVLAIVAVGIELEAERCAEPAWLTGKLDESIQSVLENMAGAHARLQDFMTAYELDSQASMADVDRIRFLVWCLTDALQAGEENEALQSAKRLDAHTEHREFDSILRALKLSRKSGAWTPTKKAMRLTNKIRGHLSERSEAICAAFS